MKEKKVNTKAFHHLIIPSDWNAKKFKHFAQFYSGGTPLTTKVEYYNGDIPFIKSGEIYFDKTEQYISIEGLKQSSAKMVEKGDLLYALYGANSGEVAISKINGAINQAILCIKNNEDCSSEFVYNFLLYKKESIIKNFLQGGQGNLSAEIIKSLIIPLPLLSEQKAIAHILGLMDTAINHNNQLIAQKELRKKWLMQNLLTGKKRLKGFTKKWESKRLDKVVTPVRQSLTPGKEELYQQIGIRSHAKGLFYKEKVTGATLGDKSVFWIEPDCLIVNIVFAWEHAIAKTTDLELGMIASHRFPMFKPKQGVVDLDYLLYYFKSKHGKYLLGLASPGGAGRNKTLGQSEFLKLHIPVPSINEQVAIAQLLLTADKEIQLLRAKTEMLKKQKKGMMQVLLTGKKRLKI